MTPKPSARRSIRAAGALALLTACLVSCGVGRRVHPATGSQTPVPAAVAPVEVLVSAAPLPPARSAFPEGEAAIDDLLLHYDPDLASEVYPVYRDLARALHTDTQLTVAVADPEHREGARLLLRAAGFDLARVRFQVCDAPISVWARDRMIPFRNAADVPEFFQPPRHRVDAEVAGDMELAHRLARTRHGRVLGEFYLEGGNVVSGGPFVFVGFTAMHENPTFSGDTDELLSRVAELFELRPLLLGDTVAVPHPHIDMILTWAGQGRVLLGDPGAGAEFLRELKAAGLDTVLNTADAEVSVPDQLALVPAYEAIRTQLLQAGLRVERLPILHTSGHGVYTWNNALLERRADGRRAYVPVYGIPRLDDHALATYRRLGFRTFPIDASRIMGRGGTVRCLTNVLHWTAVRATH